MKQKKWITILIGSTFTDVNGNWRLTVNLTEFLNELRARACRGNLCSEFSATVRVFRQSPSDDGIDLKLHRYRLQSTQGERLSLRAFITGGSRPYRLQIEWGDGKHDSSSTQQSPTLLTHVYNAVGKYNGKVTASDTAGRSATVYFSVDVHPKYSAGWPSLWQLTLLLILCSLVLLLFTRYYAHRKRKRRKEQKK